MNVIAHPVDGCPVCGHYSRLVEDDIIYQDDYWVVTGLEEAPGFVLVVARRHADGIWELSDAESESLGSLVRDLAVTIRNETKAERIHVVTFGEGALHFHCAVLPRLSGETSIFDPTLTSTRAKAVSDPPRAKLIEAEMSRYLASQRI